MLDAILASLKRLGGEARLADIYKDIERHTTHRLSKKWDAVVRRTLEEHSSDTKRQ